MDTGLKLVVIDDDDVDRMQLRRALKASGFPFTLSEFSLMKDFGDLEALNAFDCVFLDYLLPGDNGLVLVKMIRDIGIKTPVVITTSQGSESIAVALMKAGASDYLSKSDISGTSLAKVLSNVLAIQKITREREEAAMALKVSEARLSRAQRIAKIGNWEYTAGTNSFYFSEEAYNAIGLQAGTPVTVEVFMSHLHPDDRQKARDAWAEALEGKGFNVDLRVVTPEGIRFANSQGHAITGKSGSVAMIVGTLQDITERKLAEQEILKAREVAENSIKAREVFLTNMSHEIRTPMNAILGFTSLLSESALNEEQRRCVDAIQFSGENLLVVINDILDLSKIRSGKLSIEKCDFDLHDLAGNVISVMSARAWQKNLHLSHSIDQGIPRKIKGDPVRLNQILTNLIANAIKFTETGAVTLTITSRTSENHNVLIEFQVTDTGIGIPEDMHVAIFDNFVQASNDTARKFGGTGLGLTIVKSLVELLDGKISVASQPGMGATFKAQLPFEHAGTENAAAPAEALSPHVATAMLHGIAVLVAEDNSVNQLLVRKVLEKTGCTLDIAANGAEALAFMAEKRYDIVLMDIQMPGMNGYEATLKIRSELPKPLSDIPIIAMTAHAFGSDVTRCLSAGMNDYISKPFKAPELYAKIARYVRSHKDSKVVRLPAPARQGIDFTPFRELGKNDAGFIDELSAVFARQTPAFIEKLKAYTKNQNYEAVQALCHQIKSSYGILKTEALDRVLEELSSALNAKNTSTTFLQVSSLVETLINLIAVINDQVQRGLRKAG